MKICIECGKEFSTKEVKRIYGKESNVFLGGFCSAQCYTGLITSLIQDPSVLEIVHHMGWGYEKDDNYPCDVVITGGGYFGNLHGLSNYFRWRRILESGSLAEEESGYGSFRSTKDEYTLELTVKKATA